MVENKNGADVRTVAETEAATRFGDEVSALAELLVKFMKGQSCLYGDSRLHVSREFNEMVLCRCIDKSLTYISSVLELIFRNKPKMLRSQGQVSLRDVLDCTTMEEFITQLVRKKVLELSYKSVDDLDNYLQEQTGASLFSNPETRNLVVELVESRNIIVHNWSTVNERFLQKVPHSPKRTGERIDVSELAAREFVIMMEWILDLDSRLIAKFDLPACQRVPRRPIGML